MSSQPGTLSDPDLTRHLLDNEVAIVASAIDMVATGAATRVTLAGLHFGEQMTARFAPEAERAGVRLEPVYWPDDAGLDLVVRLDDDG